VELYIHSPNTPSLRGAQLNKKHRDNFTFTYTYALKPVWIRNLEKLIVAQIVKKFSAFYKN